MRDSPQPKCDGFVWKGNSLPTESIQLEDIQAAAGRLNGIVNYTPVATSRTLDSRVGARVFLKCENLQRTGSFKFRGACNALAKMDTSKRPGGVCTLSTGNHSQALALAAQIFGTTAAVFIKKGTPAFKVEATRGYKAEIHFYDPDVDDAQDLIAQFAEKMNRAVVHAHEDLDVIEGQGTLALELMDEVPDLDLLLAPVSGGGLIAGCAIAAKSLNQDMKVVGVEPEDGDDTRRSIAAGKRVHIPTPTTIADGLAMTIPGRTAFPMITRFVDDIVVVGDDEIARAMAFLFERMKMIAEPSGAITLAALLSGKIEVSAKRIGVVISGGNVDIARFCQILDGPLPQSS